MPVRFRRVRGKQDTPPGLGTSANGSDEHDEDEHLGAPELDEDELEASTEDEREEADVDEEEPTERPPAVPNKAKASPSSGASLDIENALKELAARMTMINSSVEGVKESRQEMEEKLGAVEERMMRLGALAEAVSSKYNPFLADNSPTEPSWKQAQGGAGADEPSASASPGPPGLVPLDADEGEALPGRAPPAESEVAPDASREPLELPHVPEPARSKPHEPPRQPRAEPLDISGAYDHERPTPHDLPEAARSLGRALEPRSREARFEQNLMLLEWVGLMLRRVGRAGLLDLLDYYEGLGWLDLELKNRALRVAVGVDAPDRAGDGNWRGDLDLHERSLVAIERLEGGNVTAARLEGLRMDLRRLFGG